MRSLLSGKVTLYIKVPNNSAWSSVRMADLGAALKDVLESRGVLGEVQAKLRAEVYKALDDQSVPKPDLCHENLLLNELIREYLQYNKYNYTSSVLLAESGLPKEPLERQFLARELNIPLSIDSTDKDVPLLYRMLAHFTHQEPHKPNPDHTHIEPTTSSKLSSKTTVNSRCVIEEPSFPDSP